MRKNRSKNITSNKKDSDKNVFPSKKQPDISKPTQKPKEEMFREPESPPKPAVTTVTVDKNIKTSTKQDVLKILKEKIKQSHKHPLCPTYKVSSHDDRQEFSDFVINVLLEEAKNESEGGE